MNSVPRNSPLREVSASQGISIDPKRILYQAIRYWYLIVASLCIALTIAYLNNRYATRIYPVYTSIIIKEKEETSEGRLLYNNPLVSGFRNYLNELYILRSFPMISKTIDDLNFEVSFYQEGNFLTTEAYHTLPVDARVIDDFGQGGKRFYFEIINENDYQLTTNKEKEKNKGASSVFHFGDTITFEKLRVVFHRIKEKDVNGFAGQTFLFSYTPILWLTGSYVGKLNASWAAEGAGIVNLSVSGPNPTKDIDFLNGLIRQYQEYDLQKKNQAATRTIDFITDQLNTISDSLRDAERQLEVFKDKNVITDLSSEAKRLYEKVEELETQKMEMIIRENYYSYLIKYISAGESLDQVILPSSVGMADGILTGLVTQLIDIQTQMRLYIDKGNDQNPLFQDRKKKNIDLQKTIVEAVRNQQEADKIRMEFLNKNISAIEKQMRKLPLAERQLVAITRNYSLLENLYVFLLQKKAEAGISKAATTSDILIVNPPMAGGPVSPRTSQNYMMATAVGLSLPLLFFIIMEVTNSRVQSREDVEKITTIPFIGGVGHKKSEFNLEVITAPKSAIAESFRALRSNLNYFTQGKTKAVFMITSSISGEGKTFTSINLASVFALSGSRVLIIGADLRKPKIFADFNLTNSVGLSSYLSGLADFESIIQRTSYDTLELVSAGPVPPNPSELLLSPRMAEFMDMARARYDFIIIDTPPLAIVTDAFSLAQFADHTLFLVRQNYTPKILLKNIEEYYRTGKLKDISLVLNDIYKSGPGYGYGYGYANYGYGYGRYGYGKSKNGYGYYSES